MRKITPKELAKKLHNIGPTCAKHLLDVGIDSPEKLKKLGAKKAYLKMCQHPDFCGDYNALYLYALEGAILGCDMLEIGEEKKKLYKDFTATLRNLKPQLEKNTHLHDALA